jgi:hypothetical protein
MKAEGGKTGFCCNWLNWPGRRRVSGCISHLLALNSNPAGLALTILVLSS